MILAQRRRTDCGKTAMGPFYAAGTWLRNWNIMKYIVTASEMRRYDENTIEKTGIPACVLMERAALAVVEMIEERNSGREHGQHVLVMAGTGNNGGDGLAAARLLAEKGYQVDVWCIGNREKASSLWKQQRNILEKYPVTFTDLPGRQEYSILLDALFGVGLSREVEGDFADAVSVFNRLDGWKLALDLPSGIDSDTGRILGCAVRAHATVAFGFCKRGLVLYPGCEFAGEVRTVDIGISDRSFYGEIPKMYAYDEEAAVLLPQRDRAGNKGTFGKVLLVAGSLNMAGAAVLSARAAYRAGAGMVKVITCGDNRTIMQQAVPEALFGTEDDLEKSMGWADVIAAGSGLGQSDMAFHCLESVVKRSRSPLLIDADGLNLLSVHPELKEILACHGAGGRKIVLTPHVGETARLVGQSITECKENLLYYADRLAEELHAAVIAKDARSFICQERHCTCINLSGNSGMATAGSGDVLAGIVAAFLAQGMDSFEAAAVGAYLHGRAGERAAKERGEHACMAGDLAECIFSVAR